MNSYLKKHSSGVTVTLIEKLVGMLSEKGGKEAERMSVELYFKTLKGLLQKIEDFDYQGVTKEIAQ